MEAIYSVNGKLDLIITLSDDKAKSKSGRIYVDKFAEINNIPVVKVNHINDQMAIDAIKDYEIDWLFIIGWSQIASKELLDTPKSGVIGAHPTLLPDGRGRAAIPWAIIKGLDKTGVTFFKMDEGVDTGLILGQEEIPLNEEETATQLYEKVNKAHETLIKKMYFELKDNKVTGQVQDESKATVWEGRTPKDGQIFNEMTIQEVDRLVRATTRPYPGAFVMEGEKKVIIWKGMKSFDKLNSDRLYEIKLKDGYFYADEFEINY
jgi:methionyl-tRNA formyltransferase